MNKFSWIIFTIAMVFIILVFLLFNPYRTTSTQKPSIMQSAKSQESAGNDVRSYQGSKTYPLKDGSIAVLSVLKPSNAGSDAISFIRLSPDGEVLLENIFELQQVRLLNKIKSLLQPSERRFKIEILGVTGESIDLKDPLIYVLVLLRRGSQTDLYRLALTQDGNKSFWDRIDLQIHSDTQIKAFLDEFVSFVGYLNKQEKLLCLATVMLNNATLTDNAMLFYRQDSLHINSIAGNAILAVEKNRYYAKARNSGTLAWMTAYNSKKGCSFYSHTRPKALVEHFRTNPKTDILLLKYIEDKLYGVVKEDSLLEIIDFTDFDKPVIKVMFQPSYSDFRVNDLHLIDGSFIVLLNHNTIFKFVPQSELHLVIGWGEELHSGSIIPLSDGQFFLIANSMKVLSDNRHRLFIRKFNI